MDPDTPTWTQLRTYLSASPSLRSFHSIVRCINQAPLEEQELYVEYALEHMKTWDTQLRTASFQECWPHCPDGEPLQSYRLVLRLDLSIHPQHGPPWSSDMLIRLFEHPALSHLYGLHLNGHRLDEESVSRLAESNHLRQLQELQIKDGIHSKQSIELLVSSSVLSNLKSLLLSTQQQPLQGIVEIAQSAQLTTIETLCLCMDDEDIFWGSSSRAHPPFMDAWKSILETPYLPNLKTLECSSVGLQNTHIQQLARTSLCGQLHTLHIPHNQIHSKGLLHLLESPHFHLQRLNISNNCISDTGACSLAQAPQSASLKWLSVRNNFIGTKGAQAIAESHYLNGLHLLDIAENDIGDKGIEALAASPYAYLAAVGYASHLESIDDDTERTSGSYCLQMYTQCNDLEQKERWRQHIQQHSQHWDNVLGQLTFLELWPSFPEGSPHPLFEYVETLDLSSLNRPEEELIQLFQTTHIQRLRSVDLSNQDVRLQCIQAIVESPYLSSLHSLNLKGTPLWTREYELLGTASHLHRNIRRYALQHLPLDMLYLLALRYIPREQHAPDLSKDDWIERLLTAQDVSSKVCMHQSIEATH